jgi:hypothetical protein
MHNTQNAIMSHTITKGFLIILSKETLLEQFQSFYKEQEPKTMEDAIEKFSIFGGVGWGNIDTTQDAIALIEELILPDFRYIRNDVTDLTTGMPLHHSILSAIALGDGRTHTAYRRANVSKEVGDNAVVELCESGIIRLDKEKAVFSSWDEAQSVSNKLYFTSPFLRFWFAFISPIFKGIRDGDYKEIRERFQNRKAEFMQLTFVELSHELLKLNFSKEDKLKEISAYWDNNIELDIYAKTKSGKTIVGVCKYTNAKVKKSELTRLQEACKEAKIDADIFVIISKNGFSNELKNMKNSTLRLITLKNFKKLVE